MSSSTYGQTVKKVIFAGLFALPFLSGCWNGDTDGGQGNEDLGIGSQVVSNGGFGASLTIELEDGSDNIEVAERKSFFVTAIDPSGAPLGFRRVFCETEKGIAILEPSSGGVAFEHTGPDGRMSGVLGGVTPGSYIIECRLEEGFNLVARKRLKITGEVPAGFAGFPGAAGGNLGGGAIVPNPNQDITALQVLFDAGSTGNFTPNGPIDIVFDTRCLDVTGAAAGPEEYDIDLYKVSLQNTLGQPIHVDEIEFEIDDGRGVSSSQGVGLTLAAGSTAEIVGQFTEFVVGTVGVKAFAATTSAVIAGTYNVTFTVRGETESGDSFRTNVTGAVTFGNVDNCG